MSGFINVFTRSPYIFSVNEASQTEAMIEIYMSNTIGTLPASPQYTLTKPIPSSDLTEITFDISPYFREFINHSIPQQLTDNIDQLNANEYAYGLIITYANMLSGLVEVEYAYVIATNGYTSFEDGANFDNSSLGAFAESGTYYYHPEDTASSIGHVGLLKFTGTSLITSAVYTNSVTGAVTTIDLNGAGSNPSQFRVIPRVLSANYYNGNNLKLKVGSNVLVNMDFKPIIECKYTPVKVDYIDKFGMWNFLWFFKASNENISTTSKQYNLKQSTWDFSPIYGVSKLINKTGRKTFTLNTGWMEEENNFQIEQLMLSERVLIDGKPAILKTDKTELFKHLNDKQFSYQMEFEVAYDLIQNVK
jgi:hypothetical protein